MRATEKEQNNGIYQAFQVENFGESFSDAPIYQRDLPKHCSFCWWRGGNRCFNDKEMSSINRGRLITPRILRGCEKVGGAKENPILPILIKAGINIVHYQMKGSE